MRENPFWNFSLARATKKINMNLNANQIASILSACFLKLEWYLTVI